MGGEQHARQHEAPHQRVSSSRDAAHLVLFGYEGSSKSPYTGLSKLKATHNTLLASIVHGFNRRRHEFSNAGRSKGHRRLTFGRACGAISQFFCCCELYIVILTQCTFLRTQKLVQRIQLASFTQWRRHQQYCFACMPSFFMRESSVVRFNPRRAATPLSPPTRPLHSMSARTIC